MHAVDDSGCIGLQICLVESTHLDAMTCTNSPYPSCTDSLCSACPSFSRIKQVIWMLTNMLLFLCTSLFTSYRILIGRDAEEVTAKDTECTATEEEEACTEALIRIFYFKCLCSSKWMAGDDNTGQEKQKKTEQNRREESSTEQSQERPWTL